MKQLLTIAAMACLVALAAFTTGHVMQLQVPAGWPLPVYDFTKNPLSAEKVLLGRALFYDPILSKDSTISCSSCHSQYTAFTHVDHALSHGIENRIGIRNSSALMNLAWSNSFMWDGAVNHLDMQALAPMSNPTEMDEKIDHVVKKLQASTIYPRLFYRAFADSNITGQHVLKALSQFMLTLVTADAKYDSVQRGQASFTLQEANGYRLFQQHCGSCHREPLFTNNQFENNGLSIDTTLNDKGYAATTHNDQHLQQFKVPTLRNVQFSAPYMHDGRFARLQDVLKHYTSGIVHYRNLAKPLQQPIVLSSNERVDLIAFLYTLSDKNFLFNPAFSYSAAVYLPQAKE